MKVLLSFLLPISLDGKSRRNRRAFGEKASSKATFLIFPLHNSSKDVFLLLLLYPLIVSSSLCLFAVKSSIGVFGKDNTGKGRGDNLGSTGADERTRADNLDKGTDADVGANNPGREANDPDIATDDTGKVADDSGKIANNPGTGTDADVGVDNSGTAADNLGTGMDADAGTDNQSIAASNKTRARAASLFALCCSFFLLASSSELVTVSSIYSSPFSFSTTL